MHYNTTAMLVDAGLSKSFWAEAMQCATFLIAHRPSSSNGGEAPWTKMTGRQVNPTMWKPFGCPAYTHIFKNKSHKCIMLGYTSNMKAYRLWDVDARKVSNSCHVTFNETGKIDKSVYPSLFTPSTDMSDPTQSQWEDLI